MEKCVVVVKHSSSGVLSLHKDAEELLFSPLSHRSTIKGSTKIITYIHKLGQTGPRGANTLFLILELV